MSGGFFRGTSADQDTRFSNKQAKLLKTQKFSPELDHLVDMTKVKMDVMRPWIANRVTELLGFEDEVLINFIYGLLDGKEVNGKQVQIQLTGFMEKNTAKFMKELWMLLLSAQKNASGVPQQFLDDKEEETRKKKLEADRIANEIQKRKEKENRELDQERQRNMDGAVEMKATNAALVLDSKTMLAKDSSVYLKNEKEAGERNGVRGRDRGSPSQSLGNLHSNSRSYSDDRRKSRSVSRSPKARRRSISPKRRSITPRRRHSPRIFHSPSRRSSYFRRRSRSRSPRRSPSPLRRKLQSPFRRKSPSPQHLRSPLPVQHRRSPSPFRHRRSPSPIRRRRSPSPVRRRRSPSPVRRHRSPSPVGRRRSPSPVRHRRSPSPVRHRRSPLPIRRHRSPLPVRRASPSRRWLPSPVRRRSPSPVRRRYQRSPLTPQHRSSSPIEYRSPVRSSMRSLTPSPRRSPSPYELSSPSSARRRSPLLLRRKSPNVSKRLPVLSPREKNRTLEKMSPAAHQPSSSLRSPQRDPKDRKDLPKSDSAFSPSPERSPTVSESPPHLIRKRCTSEDRRSFSPDKSPARQAKKQMARDGSISRSPRPREWRLRQDGPETSIEDKETNRTREDGDQKSAPLHGRSVRSSTVSKQKDSPRRILNKEGHSPGSEILSRRGVHLETLDQKKSLALYEDSLLGESQQSMYPGESKKSEEGNHSHKNKGKNSERYRKSENVTLEVEKIDRNNRSDTSDSGSEQSDKPRSKSKEKRKHKKYDREEEAFDDDYGYDSEIEKKEARRRRRKEEKKLRREEKRRRRVERRRRKEERHAEKLKLKNQSDADTSDGVHVPRGEYHPSDEETESEQKRLEIELRNKALESIKAKRNNSR